MAIIQETSKRKPSGGRLRSYRKKRIFNLGNNPTLTKLAKTKAKNTRHRGGNIKSRLLTCDVANVYDPKNKKYSKTKIKTIVENPANRHYVRRNIMTRGTIIETELGKARITSRPGQENVVNAVLIA